MKFSEALALRSCRRNMARSATLAVLTGILALVIFGGSEMLLGLQGGLIQFQQRLGADVIVLPKAAEGAGSLEGVLVQGVPAQFYMEEHYLSDLRSMAGVASCNECCSCHCAPMVAASASAAVSLCCASPIPARSVCSISP